MAGEPADHHRSHRRLDTPPGQAELRPREYRNASGANNSDSIIRGLVPPCRRPRRDTWQLVSSVPSLAVLQESSLPSSVVPAQESSLPSSVPPLHESSLLEAPQAAQLSAAAPHESAVVLLGGGGCGVLGGYTTTIPPS